MTEDTVNLAINGDKEAFTELFSEIQSELYRVAYIYVKNNEDARDVVQETAYRCFRSIKTLRKPEYFRTWAVRTAMNCSMNMLRKSHKTVHLEEYMTVPSESPQGQAEAAAMLEMLLNRLSAKEKSVLLMKNLYGMTLSEIAKELNMPLGTVKTIHYRTIIKLKKEDSE